MSKNSKFDIFKILLVIIAISFAFICLYTMEQKNLLELDSEALVHIEYINSGVQRISKLELENSSDDSLITLIDATSYDLIPIDGKDSKYFIKSPEMLSIVSEVVSNWNAFRTAVMTFRIDSGRDALFLASETNYNFSTTAIKDLTTYIKDFSTLITTLETILVVHVAIMGIILLKILFNTISELQKNKELSKDMFIDLATGLYNRSKCQEVLKNPVTPNNTKERAVVIFDLNDLKKTNDSLGHRAGDQLISCFAEQVKKATKIFPYETFVGRYGGDEFMAFFDSVEVDDIEKYLKEVDRLLNEFNETQNKPYKLSCAAGYSITTAETKSLSMRDLFDSADANMYQNKLAMKEKKRQELKEQGIEESIVEDDRL